MAGQVIAGSFSADLIAQLGAIYADLVCVLVHKLILVDKLYIVVVM